MTHITKEQWQETLAIRSDNTIKRQHSKNHSSPALLNGLIFDEHQNPLICHHSSKKGKHYYYYISKHTEPDGTKGTSNIRIPIKMLEQIIVNLLVHEFTDEVALIELFKMQHLSTRQIEQLLRNGQELASKLSKASQSELRVLLKEMIVRIDIGTAEIILMLNTSKLMNKLKLELPDQIQVQLTKPIELRKRGQEMKLVLGGMTSQPANKDQVLITLIAKAHLLRDELETQTITSIKEFADKYKIDHADAKNLLPLSDLSPSIAAAILNGHQPPNLNAKHLKSIGNNLPLNWEEQRQLLGFAN